MSQPSIPRTARSQQDLWAIMALFLVATVASAALLQRILYFEQKNELSLGQVTRGDRNFALKAGENCVGSLTVSVRDDELPLIVSKAVVMIRIGPQIERIRMDMSGIFNQLGQLFRGNVKIESSRATVTFRSETISPLRIYLEVSSPKVNLSHVVEIAGPLMARLRGENYELSLVGSGQTNAQLLPFSNATADKLKISVVEGGKSQCSEDNLQPVDLTEVIRQYASTLGVMALPWWKEFSQQ